MGWFSEERKGRKHGFARRGNRQARNEAADINHPDELELPGTRSLGLYLSSAAKVTGHRGAT